MIKTRFAPSPTGAMHVGNLRTALFNYLYAVAQGGTFLLRSEDTDKARSKPEYLADIMHDLSWLGISWQEGPVLQSERERIYEQYYQTLIDAELAYPCYCSEAELAVQRKLQLSSGKAPRYAGTCRHLSEADRQKRVAEGRKPSLRFHVKAGSPVVFTDLIFGKKQFERADLGDFIIRKQDGGPTFMFCNAVDDALLNVTHALRGEDHLTNTPRQLIILEALGLKAPQYGHFPIILGMDGKPLSKRNGSQSVAQLRDHGFLPETILNSIARLGHTYPEADYLDLQGLGEGFALSQIGRAPAKFDVAPLSHWQKQSLANKSPTEQQTWAGDSIACVPADKQTDFLEIALEQALTPADLRRLVDVYFGEVLHWDEAQAGILQEAGLSFFQTLQKAIEQPVTCLETMKAETGTKGKKLFLPIRLALTGESAGPHLDKVFALMGNDRMVSRIQAVITMLGEQA